MAADPDLPIPAWALEEAAKPGTRARVESRIQRVLAKLKDTALVERIRELYGYLNDPRVPSKYKVVVLAGLVYLVNPFDVIPDAIPGAGFLDDGAVVLAILEAVRRIIGHMEDSAKAVVTHAVAETEEAFARRGVQQVALSLWAITLTACVGLVYTAARGALVPGSTMLDDPFVVASFATGLFGLVTSVVLARRVWYRYRAAPAHVQEPLTQAILATLGVREIVVLTIPIVVLVLAVGIRLGMYARG